MPIHSIHLLVILTLTSLTAHAEVKCDTPIQCYQQAVVQLEQANARVKTLTAEAVGQLEQANARVKTLTAEAEKNVKLISDLNQQYQARFEDLKNQLAQQQQTLATKAEEKASDAKIRAVQNIANTAVSKADAAQNTANTAVSKADAAQNTANTAVSKADAAQSTANNAVTKTIGNCAQIQGPCGGGTYKAPLFYLDRVAFSCPDDRPILKTIGYRRCGPLNTGDEGLSILATCCSLVK